MGGGRRPPPAVAALLLDNLRSADGPSERGVLRGWEARIYRAGAGAS